VVAAEEEVFTESMQESVSAVEEPAAAIEEVPVAESEVAPEAEAKIDVDVLVEKPKKPKSSKAAKS
jgi:hypothetical protein